MPGKVGIKSFRFVRECVSFVHAWIYVPTQLELCLYDQLDNKLATCFLTFYCDLYSLFKFSLFLVFNEE